MHSTEQRRHPVPWWPRTVLAAAIAVSASVLWLAGGPGTPAQGAVHPSAAAHGPPAVASGPAQAPSKAHGHRHKEGPVAVVASVVGVIVVVVFIVGLGSLSVRRRTRHGPSKESQAGRGPPDRWWGLFR
jgi:hypothetical protein